jgi:uncharacterized membrane protein
MSMQHRIITRVQKMTLAVLTALALLAGAVAATRGARLAGDPSQWGVAKKGQFDVEVARKGSFDTELARKVNEYEGQHLG